MFKLLPRSLQCRMHSLTKRRFSTNFSVSRRGIETSFDSPYSLEEVISKAAALPFRSDFLLDLLQQYNSAKALSEKQESWVRFFVWEAEESGEKQNYEITGLKVISVISRTGEVWTFNTELSLGEAASICKQIERPREFIQSLVSCYCRNSLSQKQIPWLFKIAQEELEKNGTQPKPIYTITKAGRTINFDCDWSLEKAYETLKNNIKPKDEFANKLLYVYEKDRENMSPGRQAWLFRLALESIGEISDEEHSTSPSNSEEVDENIPNTYKITRYGQTEEFVCDWPLEKAFDILQSQRAFKNEFHQSLLDSFQRDGENMSRNRKAWLFKLAMDITARSMSSEGSPNSESVFSAAQEGSCPQAYTVYVKGRPISFETDLTIQRAVAFIDDDDKKNKFRDDLVEQYKKDGQLSEKQLSWIFFFGHQLKKSFDEKVTEAIFEDEENTGFLNDDNRESEGDGYWSQNEEDFENSKD